MNLISSVMQGVLRLRESQIIVANGSKTWRKLTQLHSLGTYS